MFIIVIYIERVKVMIRDARRKYFEIWGNEEAQNAFLKGVILILGSLVVIQSCALSFLAIRKPILIALGQSESRVLTLSQPSADILKSELDRVIRRYAEVHYTWDSTTVEKAHAEAAHYVGTEFVKGFQAANADQVRIAKEKKLSQRVFITDLVVDANISTAKLTMDRILMIEGLRAATNIVLEIKFEYGPRTVDNPEGVYITSEKLVSSS